MYGFPESKKNSVLPIRYENHSEHGGSINSMQCVFCQFLNGENKDRRVTMHYPYRRISFSKSGKKPVYMLYQKTY